MARRPAAAANEPKGPSVTGKKALKDLLTLARETKNNVAEIAGTFGQAVKDAVENKNLHRKAFGQVKQLDCMEAAKLAEFFYHFDRYCDLAGLRERAATAPNFWEGDDAEGEAEGEDENVHQLHAAE